MSRPRVLLIEKCEDCPYCETRNNHDIGIHHHCNKAQNKSPLEMKDIPKYCPLSVSDW